MKLSNLGLLVLCASGPTLLGCDRPDPAVPALEERLAHLESTAATERDSYERQVRRLEGRIAELEAENAELSGALETYRTVSGSDRDLEAHLRLLEQRLDACFTTLDATRERLESATAPPSDD